MLARAVLISSVVVFATIASADAFPRTFAGWVVDLHDPFCSMRLSNDDPHQLSVTIELKHPIVSLRLSRGPNAFFDNFRGAWRFAYSPHPIEMHGDSEILVVDMIAEDSHQTLRPDLTPRFEFDPQNPEGSFERHEEKSQAYWDTVIDDPIAAFDERSRRNRAIIEWIAAQDGVVVVDGITGQEISRLKTSGGREALRILEHCAQDNAITVD